MNLTRPLLLLGIGALVALAVLKLSISSLAASQVTLGCQARSETGLIDPTETVAFWQNQSLPALTGLNDTLAEVDAAVLGATSDNKWIEVDLGKQKLIAHEGDSIFLESAISSGLWNKTPVGEYRIWYKIRATKMEGGSKLNKTYYYLPNVPFAMFFHGDYGIHGTYWHNNFGRRMSHGCVNAPTPVAEKLFYWTDPQLSPGTKIVRSTAENPGTRVVVHD